MILLFIRDLICLLTASQRRRKHFARELTVARASASLYIFIYSSTPFHLSFLTYICLKLTLLMIRFMVTPFLFTVFFIFICCFLRSVSRVPLRFLGSFSCCHRTCTRSNTRSSEANTSDANLKNEKTAIALSQEKAKTWSSKKGPRELKRRRQNYTEKMSVFQKPLGHSDTVRIIICSNAPPTSTIDNNNTNEIVWYKHENIYSSYNSVVVGW